MKKPVIVLILSCTSLFSFSQIQREHAKTDTIANNGNGKKDMIKELDLSTGQQAKFKEIRQTGRMKKQDIERNDRLTDAEKKKQLRQLQKEQAQNIQEILTEEQKEKFRANRAKNRKAEEENNN